MEDCGEDEGEGFIVLEAERVGRDDAPKGWVWGLFR